MEAAQVGICNNRVHWIVGQSESDYHGETGAMLTMADIDALNALARDLAQRSCGGTVIVGRTNSGIVRLTIVKHGRSGGRALFRERDISGATLEDASSEIAMAIQSAANP
jgi:hypothetical protein